jgi:hypothetical protein
MPTTDTPLTEDAMRFRFPPRDSRGLLLGLRPRQVALLGAAGICLVIGPAARGTAGLAVGILAAIALALVCFVPVGGRSLEQWTPILGAWAWRGPAGRRWRGGPAQPESDGITLPAPLDTLALLSASTEERQVAIAADRRRGTYTAVLALSGRMFPVLERSEQQRRVRSWGACLDSLAREGSPIGRVEWTERTLPDDGSALRRWFTDHAAYPDSPQAQSYAALIDSAGPVTQTHETYLAVQLDARRARRAIRQAGGGDTGAATVLLRELRTLETRLRAAELNLTGWLPPRALARLLRTAYEPGSRTILAGRDGDGDRAGCAPAAAGPTAADTHWSTYRTDDAWHATYWIAEWPRLDVDADFLTPLLLRTTVSRTVSVVMEPVNPRRAAREVQAARTAELADEALREKAGQITTARRRTEHEALLARERELVAGHGDYRFTGYVTVTAPTLDALEIACGEIEQAAHQSLLEVRRLYGEQDTAFAAALPLCWSPR